MSYCTLDRAGAPPPVHTHSVDVSEGGLAFATEGPLEVDETVSLELRPDPDRRRVLATGRVVFSRESTDGWVTGVELCWVDGGAMTPGQEQTQTMWSFL